MGFKPDLDDQLVSFSALTLFVHLTYKIVPKMTYNVLSGTLSLCTTITTTDLLCVKCDVKLCSLT